MRQRPARGGGAEAEPGLQVEPVDLVDDAVDVVAEGGALGLDGAVPGEHLLGAVAADHQRVGGEAEGGEPRDGGGLGVGQRLAELAPGIGEEMQRPGGADAGVELAQAAGGGVARVGEGAAAGGGLAGVQRREVGMAHVGLAADLEDRRGAGQGLGDVGDGAGIRGDVLAGLAVAAGGGLHQPAGLVAQRQRQAVDLGLGGEGEGIARREAEEAADALDELGDLGGIEGVLQAEERQGVADLGEALGGGGADPVAGAVGALELGEARLDGGVAPLQRIIVGIDDPRRVGLVIGEVRGLDGPGQLGELLPGGLRREVVDGGAGVQGGASPGSPDGPDSAGRNGRPVRRRGGGRARSGERPGRCCADRIGRGGPEPAGS